MGVQPDRGNDEATGAGGAGGGDGAGRDGAGSWLSRRKLLVGAFLGTVVGSTVGSEGLHWAVDQVHSPGTGHGRTLQVYGGDDSALARQNALQVWEATPSTQQAKLTARYNSTGATSTEQFSKVENLLIHDPASADLIIIDPEYLAEMVSKHELHTFDAASSESLRDLGCFRGIIDRCTVHGELYSVPLNADAPLLVVDLSLLSGGDRRRLPALARLSRPDAFWSAVASMAGRSVGPEGTRKVLLQTGDYEGMTVCLVELICAFGGNVSADPTLAGHRNRTALATLRRALPTPTFAMPADSGDETATRAAVERHETVFARLWPAQCHTLTTGDLTDESTAAQFAVIPIPGGVLGGQVLAVTKTSPDRRQSQDLANYLSQPLSQLQLFHDGGYVPTLRQLHADRQVVTELKGLGGHLGQATVRPALAHYTGWSRQFRSSVRAYLLHQSDDIPRDITTPLSPFT